MTVNIIIGITLWGSGLIVWASVAIILIRERGAK